MRHIERGPKLGQPLLNLFGSLPVAFGGRSYAHRAQQFRRRHARVTRLAEHRVEAFAGQMVKNEVDDAPGVECLVVGVLIVGSHGPEITPARENRRSQLETVTGNMGFTL